jgi:hypothetical protein
MTPENDTSEILINPDDFRSVRLKISLNNTTTKTEIKDGKRFFGNKKGTSGDNLEITLIELLDQGMILEVPGQSCAQGHNLLITVESLNTKPPITFQTSAKVMKMEKVSDDRDTIEINLIQFDDTGWQALKGLYGNRQNEIEEFFKAAKGY